MAIQVYKKWSQLTDTERLECLRRYILFARKRARWKAKRIRISHVSWNRWCSVFGAPQVPCTQVREFYKWLLRTFVAHGLKPERDYEIIVCNWRAGYSRTRVRAIVVDEDALHALDLYY